MEAPPDDWLKVGGKARIFRKPREGEAGSNYTGDYLGKDVTIKRVTSDWADCDFGQIQLVYSKACLEPIFEGSYQERQDQWIKFHGIKVGSKVKVARKAEDDKDGWENNWPSGMDVIVGEIHTVKRLAKQYGIDLDGFRFPYFVLEPV